MALTPRKEEKQAIAELLEASYDSADALAAAVLKRAFELFQQRDLYLLAASNSFDQKGAAFGPFASERDAERASRDSVYGYGRTMKLYDVSLLKPQDAVADKDKCKCGHPRGTHEHPKTMGVCLAGARNMKSRPCQCTHFE